MRAPKPNHRRAAPRGGIPRPAGATSACVRAHLLAARSRPLAEAGLIYVLPDDSSALVALQIGSGAVVGLASIVLLAVASLFGLLQGKN